jgi:hypothetical protein
MNIEKYKQTLKVAMGYIKEGKTVEDVKQYLHGDGVNATTKQIEDFKSQVEADLVAI